MAPSPSARTLLRAFQSLRREALDPGLVSDIDMLRQKDIDLSIKFGGLLAFNALLIGAALLPISASPGAPLSLDAPSQPMATIASAIAALLLLVSCFFCVRGLLAGERFQLRGEDVDATVIGQRILAAYCHSIDFEVVQLRWAIGVLAMGAMATAGVLAFALWDKIAG